MEPEIGPVETDCEWPQRVAIATNNLFVGGAQQLVLVHGQALAERGIQVVVVDLVGGLDRLAGEVEPLRVAVRDAGLPLVDMHIRSARDWPEWRRALAWFRNWRPDVVHGHLAPADRWAAFLGKTVGAKTFYTKHDTYRSSSRHALRAERWAARILVDRVVAISDVTREHLIEHVGVPASKIVTIPNPVDHRRFDPERHSGIAQRASLGWSDPDLFVVGFVGRLVARKGLSLWLDTAAEAKRQVPGMRFVIVGDGEERPTLERMAAELGLTEHIHFAGRQSDIPEWLASLDALLFTPLRGEGLPIALLEAMSMRLPIVASNIGANRELLDGVGLLPEPSEWSFEATTGQLDARLMADAVVRLAHDEGLRDDLGRAARRRIEERFTVDRIIDQQLECYRSLHSGRAHRPGRT